MKNPQKLFLQITKRLSEIKWRFLLLLIVPISLLLFISITTTARGGDFSDYNPFYFLSNLKSLFYNDNNNSNQNRSPNYSAITFPTTDKAWPPVIGDRKSELEQSRMAVCLVGGARRFELTGPSIVEKILEEYPNADLFVNSPLDSKSYKFSLLKTAPRIAAIRIFKPEKIPENDAAVRVLTASNSPNGIQGLLQYFNLVEGCLTMVESYQKRNNFTYDWIVRTRVDGYWSTRLRPDIFIPGHYVVPSGSSYGGLNDRFGVGDFNTSVAALSRLSMIPEIDSAGFHELNSESAFQAQLRVRNISFLTKRLPFCVVSDRTYDFPPEKFGVPVAALSSKGPLSGVKCRPCTAKYSGKLATAIVNGLYRQWSWTDTGNNTLQLCDGHGRWEDGWEKLFDSTAGKKLSAVRKRVSSLSFEQCVADFEFMKRRSAVWDVPPAVDICSQFHR
ncbi:uncharacterized protein LOC112506952 [Cynara cardunculus var. scolymus]|uniref:DUF7796 domain-containing protein n=1 Tax=Cynara cardunculus var. scolymus TaxID=59895 RepID=A0A118K4N7_CYNCS|nr:uncharacterized protein LOC112506952 [Cynara cardunculus var. scolymus]KVI07727.1 hypothetical protein Ccrd_013910 [Cynara cardunculus var. scolymus]